MQSKPIEAGFKPEKLDAYVLNADGQIITEVKWEQGNSGKTIVQPIKVRMKVVKTHDNSKGQTGEGEPHVPPEKVHYGDVSGMRLYTYIYIYIYIYIYTHTHTRARTHTHTHIHACVYVCI
jgi:hypothetical protein